MCRMGSTLRLSSPFLGWGFSRLEPPSPLVLPMATSARRFRPARTAAGIPEAAEDAGAAAETAVVGEDVEDAGDAEDKMKLYKMRYFSEAKFS